MQANPIVALQGVNKSYGRVSALERTELTLSEGEFVTLLGPSGCGKTTTLRLIGGFEFPSAGRVLIDGRDMTAAPPYERPVNTVFQDYALFPHMTVAQNIRYGLSVRGSGVTATEAARRVEEALALVGLEKFADRRPAMMSGGQRQRVAMARAIARRPRVLLLDEPLSALDVKLREGMQGELKRLHRELGITFLMVTHDQSEAMALSDRVVVMQAGRICQIGPPEDLYDRPATPYVADFIGGANLVPGQWLGREGEVDRLAIGAAGTTLVRRGAPLPGLAPGQKVLVGLRPDSLRPLASATAGAEGENRITGRIRDSLFRGDHIRVEFALGEGDPPLFAQVPRGLLRAREALAPHAEFAVTVSASDILLFPAEDTA